MSKVLRLASSALISVLLPVAASEVEEGAFHGEGDGVDVVDVDVVVRRMDGDHPRREGRLVEHCSVLALVQVTEERRAACVREKQTKCDWGSK